MISLCHQTPRVFIKSLRFSLLPAGYFFEFPANPDTNLGLKQASRKRERGGWRGTNYVINFPNFNAVMISVLLLDLLLLR